jgi:hypothetical protein
MEKGVSNPFSSSGVFTAYPSQRAWKDPSPYLLPLELKASAHHFQLYPFDKSSRMKHIETGNTRCIDSLKFEVLQAVRFKR